VQLSSRPERSTEPSIRHGRPRPSFSRPNRSGTWNAWLIAGRQVSSRRFTGFVSTGSHVSSSLAAILPGALADVLRVSANGKGGLQLEKPRLENLRLRIVRIWVWRQRLRHALAPTLG
jgi:hypothetical protein